MSSDKLIEAVEHYQRNLARGMRDGNNTKVMHCIFKLSNMPITTGHLEETGIGRTVNAMRKMDGEIGDAARQLVSKWKQMVSQNQDCDESTENTSTESTSKSDSSHSRSDKSKNTEKRHSPRSEDEQSDESDSSSDENEREDREDKSSATSDNKTSGSEAEEGDDNFGETSRKPKRSRHDSPPPRRKNEEKKLSASSKERNGKHHSKDDDRRDTRRDEEKDRDRREEDKRKKRDEDDDKKREKRKDKDFDTNGKSRSSEKDRKSKDGRRDEERSSSKQSTSSSKRKREKSEDRSSNSKPDQKHKDRDSSSKSSKHRSEESRKTSSSTYTDKSRCDSSKEKDTTKKKDSSRSIDKSKTTKASEEKSSSKSSSKLEVVETGISSECGTSFADALGMLEPSTSKNVKRPKTDKLMVQEKLTPEKDRRPHRSEEREHRHDKERKKLRESKEPLPPKETDDRSPTKVRVPEIVMPPPPPTPLPKGDIDITSLLPPITPNYKPMANPMIDFSQRTKAASDEYEALGNVMYQKNARTKVYSGNKCGWSSVPSLFEMCIRILQDNIDALEYTGGVPYAILKPVLDKASPQQLYNMEHFNAYLMEDTDELWRFHCQKEFKTKRREELESWRDMYMRCLDEREAKLKALTENIKQSQDKSTPVRQTKLAYMDSIVKPPRDIARKQAKNGVEIKRPLVTPQQRLNSIAAGSSGAVSVPNPVRPVTSGSSGIKPKKAPLMQKTLALLKGGRFRR